jgi:hypothetical protein
MYAFFFHGNMHAVLLKAGLFIFVIAVVDWRVPLSRIPSFNAELRYRPIDGGARFTVELMPAVPTGQDLQ